MTKKAINKKIAIVVVFILLLTLVGTVVAFFTDFVEVNTSISTASISINVSDLKIEKKDVLDDDDSNIVYDTSVPVFTVGDVNTFQYTVENNGVAAVKLNNTIKIAWDIALPELSEAGVIYLYPASMTDSAIRNNMINENASNAIISSAMLDNKNIQFKNGEVRKGFQIRLEDILTPIYLDSNQTNGQKTSLSAGKTSYIYEFKIVFGVKKGAGQTVEYFEQFEGKNLKVEIDTSAIVANVNSKAWEDTKTSLFMLNSATVDPNHPIFGMYDSVAPVLNIDPTIETIVLGDIYDVLGGVTAVDDKDGDITAKIVASSTLDTTVVGTYTIEYTVKDKNNNTATGTRTVNVVKNNLSDKVVIDTNCTQGNSCFYTPDITDNYVWYSGYLWQIVKVNEDGTVMLISVDGLASLSGYSSIATTYNNSYFRQWLNNDFYNTLYDKTTYVADHNFCYGNEKNECSASVSDKVGLIRYSEYMSIFDQNYNISFFAPNKYTSMITPYSYSTGNYWAIDNYYNVTSYWYSNGQNVNPVINIKKDISYALGTDGSINNPYLLAGDVSAIKNSLLSNRNVGEYVKFAGTVWRVVDTNETDDKGNRITKLIAINLDTNYSVFDETSPSTFNPTKSTNIGYYINNSFYKELKNKEAALDSYLSIGSWYLGNYSHGADYRSTKNTTVNPKVKAKIGLPRVGELFSGQESYLNNNYYYMITPYDEEQNFYMEDSSNLNYAWYGDQYYFRPELYLASDVTIVSGSGKSYNNPYILSTKSYVSLNGNEVVNLKKGTSYAEAGYTAKDKNGSTVTSVVVDMGNFDANKIGTYTFVYSFTDSDGKFVTAKRTVIVSNYEGFQSENDSYTTYIVPSTGRYLIEAWGAAGGGKDQAPSVDVGKAGLGGYAAGEIELQAGTELYLYIGKRGIASGTGLALGGYNGGGSGYASSVGEGGAGGGGSSDVRVVAGIWNTSTSLRSRILVAAGGGGGGEDSGDYGGAGGDTKSYFPYNTQYEAFQTYAGLNGSFGLGASTDKGDGGGGGGGYYGGGTASSTSIGTDTQGGAGGSGFVSGHNGCNAVNPSTGIHTGNSNYYPEYIFENTKLIAGDSEMPLPDGTYGTNIASDGYIKITKMREEYDPIITILSNASITLTIGDVYMDAGATATDNEDGDLTSRIVVTSTVDTTAKGIYTVTYTVSDNDGNTTTATRVVTVLPIDNEAPVITVVGETYVEHSAATIYLDLGATAVDNEDGEVQVIATGNVNAWALGQYTITYTATDKSGNTATVERTVKVIDNVKPTINFQTQDMTVEFGTFDPFYQMTLSDNLTSSTTLRNNLVVTNFNTTALGLQTLTYVTVDEAGNTSDSYVRNITIVDTTPPVISIPAKIYIPLGIDVDYMSMLKVIDAYDGDLTSTTNKTGDYDKNTAGTYNITFSKTDSSGNTANKILSIIVNNTILTYNLDYTDGVQLIYIKDTDKYKMEAWGAEGGGSRLSGNGSSGLGGKGAYTAGDITVNGGTYLYVYVGGYGKSATNGLAEGGYNGGGQGYASSSGEPGNGGGGASDIRLIGGLWDEIPSLRSRIMVAAGGGGGGEDAGDAYGHGGTTTSIIVGSGYTNYNASQIAAGVNGGFGFGAGTNKGDGGGGGGGYYGGGTTSSTSIGTDTQGGGGGSSFISGCSGCNAVNADGTHRGNATHYSGLIFTNMTMTAGSGNVPNPRGTGTISGNIGNGYIKMTKYDTIGPMITLIGDTTVHIKTGGTYVEQGATGVDEFEGTKTVISTGTVNTLVPGAYTVTYNSADSKGNNSTPTIRTVIVGEDIEVVSALVAQRKVDNTANSSLYPLLKNENYVGDFVKVGPTELSQLGFNTTKSYYVNYNTGVVYDITGATYLVDPYQITYHTLEEFNMAKKVQLQANNDITYKFNGLMESKYLEFNYIKESQIPNGAIISYYYYQWFVDNKVTPYFSSLGARFALKDIGSYKVVKDYLQWYFDHIITTSTTIGSPSINVPKGSIYDYKYDCTSGSCIESIANPNDPYDSVDAYASTFFDLVLEYVNATGDKQFIIDNFAKVKLQEDALEFTFDATKGLTITKPNYPIYYLMDNCESYSGYNSLAKLYQVLFSDTTNYNKYVGRANTIKNSVNTNLLDTTHGSWKYYKYHYDATADEEYYRIFFSEDSADYYGLNVGGYYPDVVGQLYPILHGIVSPNDAIAIGNNGLYDIHNGYSTYNGNQWFTFRHPDKHNTAPYPNIESLVAALKLPQGTTVSVTSVDNQIELAIGKLSFIIKSSHNDASGPIKWNTYESGRSIEAITMYMDRYYK